MNNITYADDVPKDIYKPSFYYDSGEVRPIPDAEGYYVSESGKVYSTRKGEFKLLKSSLDSRGNYLLVSIKIDGIYKSALLHRLVAKAFVPNPDNLPEVNHKDKNKQNCHYTNLEWCTRKENLNDSYSTMGPTRNYRVAKLYRNDELIGEFEGIAKAARYANKKFGVSFSSLDKYLRCGEFRIEYDGKQTRCKYENKQFKTRRKIGEIRVYRIDINNHERFVCSCKTYNEVSDYFKSFGIKACAKTVNNVCITGRQFHGYVIKREQ